MAEKDYLLSASQETPPLSEESYRLLFQHLEGPFTKIMDDVIITDASNSQKYADVVAQVHDSALDDCHMEDTSNWRLWQINQEPEQFLNPPTTDHLEHRRPPSSLPASENWPGDFKFNVSFKCHEKGAKGLTWIFSKEKNKLYVGKDVPCPINFSTCAVMPDDVSIRAMALYSSSESASEAVKRCINHSVQENDRGIFEAEHLIRCESNSAYYESDPFTGRHSVIVPFENPAVGEQFSSYLYKFMCFGSCAGGPNRRPLILVFTLERGGEVIGRQKVDLKICACPSRDYKADEKLDERLNKRPNEDTFGLTSEECSKKQKPKLPEEPYIIKVHDKECYRFLNKMRKYFITYQIAKKCYPQDFKCLIYSSQSSDDTQNSQ